MIQDIAPHVYHNEMSFAAARTDDFVLYFTDSHTLYVNLTENALRLPTVGELGAEMGNLQYLFSVDERGYYLLRDVPAPRETDEFAYLPTARLRGCHKDEALFACAAGESLSRWYAGNRFCGHCGVKMQTSKLERAMVCPDCGNTVYPKICPAVIVAVSDGERLLLTRYKNRPIKHYALVAGFNEIGESIEDTVRREVLEETGVHVKNLRFYKSQPWVFTDTLLFGFYAELDGSDRITVQEDELSEALWVSRAELPEDTTHISLTAEMIERFRRGETEM